MPQHFFLSVDFYIHLKEENKEQRHTSISPYTNVSIEDIRQTN